MTDSPRDLLRLQAAYDRALVTGGGSGLGRAIALALAEAGVHVTVMGRRLEPLEETRALSGGKIDIQQGSVRDEADVERVFAACEAAGRSRCSSTPPPARSWPTPRTSRPTASARSSTPA